MDDLIGRTLSHYRIVEKIGEGGMGEVYCARDDRLGRDVAIKVLPEAVSRDPERLHRFGLEARAAGSLNHPNILTVYDVGEQDGQPYTVTELLRGESLYAAISHDGMEPSRALELGIQIASGLAAAHEHGIVHRDLKPSNLFVTRDGYVKILDFGIAKLRPDGGTAEPKAMDSEKVREGGTLVGTVGYMSPEHLRGLPTDARSDIFSFGCVLHEMLCGRPAFTGSTPAAFVSAVLAGRADHTTAVKPGVPEALARLVRRCLEVRPEDRFQSARELMAALKDLSIAPQPRVAGPTVSRWLTRRRAAIVAAAIVIVAVGALLLWQPSPLLGFSERDWILVADFAHPEGEADLGNALELALTVGLQESGYINVIDRRQIADTLQMMERPSDTTIDAAVGLEVCQRASLRGLLVPEVARLGSGYLVTAQLIDPVSEATVASFSARSDSDDGLLEALDELLARLRRELGDSLTPLEVDEGRLAMVTTGSIEALKAYTRGKRAWFNGDYLEAVDHYRAAIAIDPDFASAYASLGSAYASYPFGRRELAAENFDAALARLDRVSPREINFIRAQHASFLGHVHDQIRFLELHLADYPDDIGARFNLGICYRQLELYGQCVEEYREVLHIAPRHAGALTNLATCLASMGKDRQAVMAYRRAFEVQPRWQVDSNLNHEYGVTLIRAGLFSEARETFEKRLAQADPGNRGSAHRSLGHLELYRGQFEKAADHFRQAATLHSAAGYALSETRDRIFEAYAEMERGRRVVTVDALEQALAVVPSDAGAIAFYVKIGSVFLDIDDLATARSIGDRLAARQAESGDDFGEENTRWYQVFRARVLFADGEVERALEILEAEEQVSTIPNPDLFVGLAEAYEATGRWEACARALRTLIEKRWDFYEGLVAWITAHYRLAQVLERLGNPEEATVYYRRFVDLWGDADAELPRIEDARRRLESLGE